jgi:hypothetical protein
MQITLGLIHGPVEVRVDLGLAPAARGRAESSTSADDGSPSGGTGFALARGDHFAPISIRGPGGEAKMSEEHVPVLIRGGGGAGLTASILAHPVGAPTPA